MKSIVKHSDYLLSEDYSFELLNFFGDEFGKTSIQSPNDYILSNYYCDLILNHSYIENIPFDGIVYPSVQYSYQDYNMVLQPRAMSKLAFSSACYAWVIYNSTPNSNSVQFVELETAFANEQGDINWKMWKH